MNNLDHHPADFTILETLSGYQQYFMDPELWRTYVETVFLERGVKSMTVCPGLAGTYPTFIVNNLWVIKFFGRLFDGWDCFQVECEIGKLISASGPIPAPPIVFSGRLEHTNSTWYYLVMDYLPGRSIGEVYQQVAHRDKLVIATRLGKMMCAFHALPIPAALTFGASVGLKLRFSTEWQVYRQRLRAWFERRMQSGETGLPDRLARQVVAYLDHFNPPSTKSNRLHLIHADITRDHVLGDFEGERWNMHGLIDFGDCMSGDLYYELVALHLDLFDCDKRLLTAFLDAYGLTTTNQPDFPHWCMTTALQHQFEMGMIFERHPQLAACHSLSELATVLWDLNTPGVAG